MTDQFVVVQTNQGQLRGKAMYSTFSQTTYYAFLGIPYAKPPIGPLRFKAPEPFDRWEGVRDALDDFCCPKQKGFVTFCDPDGPMEGDEDCLYLNVFINELPARVQSKKPVMVSIHGGGFQGYNGNSKTHGPQYLLEGNVVFVSFNYRCGVFGFLSLEDSVVPGNAGLKDQLQALRWVQENIQFFGGDPNNVTIFGISAGGASVGHMLISPAAKGFYHKAILHSGTCLCPWALQRHPRKNAQALARSLGCSSDDPEELLAFLQSLSADDVIRAAQTLGTDKAYEKCLGFVFLPSVEVSGCDPFLPHDPYELMKKGEFSKVPIIIGGVVNEGVVIGQFGDLSDKELDRYNRDPGMLVPPSFHLTPESEEEEIVGKAIQDFYSRKKPFSLSNFKDFLKFHNDKLFNISLARMTKAILAKNTCPVYSYLFTLYEKGCKCLCSSFVKNVPLEYQPQVLCSEVCHAVDGAYLYSMDSQCSVLPELTESMKEAIRRHVKAWTTFASTGDPNCKELGVTWENTSESKPCYMDIGTSWAMKEGIPHSDRIAFWEDLWSKYSPSQII